MKKFIQFLVIFACFFLLYDHYNAYAENNHVKFTVTSDSADISEKRNGTLVVVGSLTKGQTFTSDYEYTSWYKFKIASKDVYIHKNDTKSVVNSNKSTHLNHKDREFTIKSKVTVYDNSGNVLKPIAILEEGSSFPALKEYTSWISIQVADRVGFIRKSEVTLGFASNDSYFKVMEDDVSIYKKTSSGLMEIGILEKGQTYPRLKDYTDWHQIQYNNDRVYVSKANTVPSSTSVLENEINKNVNSGYSITTTEKTDIYDNSSGKLISFAKLNENVTLSLKKEHSSWYEVVFSNRIGFIKKGHAKLIYTNKIDYFQANVDTGIYVKGKKKLEHIGTIKKGQVYPIKRHYTSWLTVSLNGEIAYIQKEKTSPIMKGIIKSEVKKSSQAIGTIKMDRSSPVYDNSSGNLIPFATLNKSITVNVTQVYSSWYKVEIAGRYGYIKRSHASFENQLDNYLLGKNINSKQMIVVESNVTSSIYATLNLYEKTGDTWHKTLSTSAVLGKNGSSSKKLEGDGKTPIGLFPLKDAFGTKDKPEKVDYPYTKTTSKDYWVDDSSSSDYNKWVTYNGKPSARWKSYEKLTNSLYKHAIVIGYNDQPIVKGKGSAIFLHVWRKSTSPTLGCVAISEGKLIQVLQKLDEKKNPQILIGTNATIPTFYYE